MLWIVLILVHAAASQTDALLDLHLTKCVSHISDSYINEGFLITVSMLSKHIPMQTRRLCNFGEDSCNNTTIAFDLLHTLHVRNKWPILTWFPLAKERKYNKIPQDIHHKSKGYILLVPSAPGLLNRQLRGLRSFRNTWNSRARFLLIVDEVLPDPRHGAEEILREVAHLNIFNVIVVIPSNGVFRALDIYSWFPFELPSGQCGNIKSSSILDQWVVEGNGRFFRNMSLFPPKIPRKFGGCNITAALLPHEPFVMLRKKEENEENITVYNEGSELRLFLFVAEAINMSVMFIPPKKVKDIWPTKLENGTWTGVLGDVLDHKADIAFSGLSINLDRFMYFDITNVYHFCGLSWMVPSAEPLQRWSSITRVFSAYVWLLIFILIILCAGFMYSLSSCRSKFIEELRSYSAISNCFYDVWAIFLGISVPKMPLTDHVKIFFVVLVWYCLAINTVFQAFVTTHLIDPGFQKQISSLEDLIASGIEYGYYPGLDGLLLNNSDWRYKEILSHRIPCYNNTCIERAIRKKDFGTLSDAMYTDYITAKATKDAYGRSVAFNFKQESKVRLIAMYLRKGSFFTENFNRVIKTAVEAGLINLWLKNILYTLRINAVGVAGQISMDDYTVISMTHLQGAFYMLGLGHCLAFAIFVGELLHKKLQIRARSLRSKNHLPSFTCTGRERRKNWSEA